MSKAKKKKVVKKKIGRPTKYKPEYDQLLIDHMASGLSFLSFAAVVDVAESTLFYWVDTEHSFSEAKKVGFSRNRLFYEKAGAEGMYMGGKDNPFNSTIWIFNMKNRFPNEWRERKEVKAEVTTTLESLIEESQEDNDE